MVFANTVTLQVVPTGKHLKVALNPLLAEMDATRSCGVEQLEVGEALGLGLGLGWLDGMGVEVGDGLEPGRGLVSARPEPTTLSVTSAWQAPFQQMPRRCCPSSRSSGRKIVPRTRPLPSARKG